MPRLQRQIEDLADLLGVRLRERSSEHSEVLAEDPHPPAVDGAVAGDDPVAGDSLRRETELLGAVGDEHVELEERARVEQELESFARPELSLGVLGGEPGSAPALAGLRFARAQLLDPVHGPTSPPLPDRRARYGAR